MTVVEPLVVVDAPAPPPRRYGLFSVASMLGLEVHEHFGVQYDPVYCTEFVTLDAGPCDRPPKEVTPEGERITADPFSVQGALDCKPIGRDMSELNQRLETAFIAGEESAVEEHVYADLASMAQALNTTAVTIPEGFGMLERWLERYGGSGTIVAPRELSAKSDEYGSPLVERTDGTLETRLGNRVAFIATATKVGPDGTPAGDGEAWVYASGVITVRREAQPSLPGGPRGQLDLDTNDPFVMAERTYVVTVDCPVAGVLVESVPESLATS